MKKTHWPARLAAGCLVTLTLVGVAFAAGQQGSQSDPLVTLSYLTQKATPSILSQVDSKLTARETELKEAALRRGRRLCQGGGGQAGILRRGKLRPALRRRILSGSQPLRRANHHRRRGV